MEFAFNASISDKTKYASFELNCGYMPSMLQEICEPGLCAPGIRDFAEMALCNLVQAHDSIIESCMFQAHYANKRRCE